MIVLDTNVVSEIMKLEPGPAVVVWLAAQHPDEVVVTSITVAELLLGVAEMPAGRKRDMTEARVRKVIALFGPEVLAFDREAAAAYALLAAGREDLDAFDGQIAAIARVHRASVATRNIRHFEALGVDLIDPWSA